MNSKYQEVNKDAIIKRHILCGESVATIVADTGIPRSTIYNWIKYYNEPKNNN